MGCLSYGFNHESASALLLMKNCPRCNTELTDDSKFCPQCGEAQEEKVLKIRGRVIRAVSAEDTDDFFFNNTPKNAPEGKIRQENEEPDKTIVNGEKRENEAFKANREDSVETGIRNDANNEIKKKIKISSISPDEFDELGSKDPNGIAWFEFVDESVFIDDPFSSHIDYEAEEYAAMKSKNIADANKMLDTICYNEKIKEALYPLTSPHVTGFRCIISGNDGSNKEANIQVIANILQKVGKIDTNEIVRIPFGKIPEEWDVKKLYVISDLNTAIERLFNLEDVSDESNALQQEYVRYMNRLLGAPRSAYIIINAYITQVQGFLSLDARIRYIFSRRVDYPDLTNDEIYDIFYEELPEFHKLQLPDAFRFEFNEYLNRNRRFFPFNNKELGQYLAQASSQQAKFELPADKYNAASLEQAFSTIIGMNDVKTEVYELQQYLKARKDLEAAGAKLPSFHMHMMFLGNPGVGKTTIARIIAKVLFELGYTREEKLIEVTSKDLVGNGNQTGIKTNKAILSALGGVLFIDEAYSLARSCGQAGDECIATLIKAMEDYKNDLVCMFAGYTLEMNDFVKANSGMQSRIAYTFTFNDYTNDELYQIFELKIRQAGMFIAPDAVMPIKKIIEWGSGRRNFGNGRFVDKLIQNTLTKHATLNLPKKELLTIKKQSVPSVEEIMRKFGRFMG